MSTNKNHQAHLNEEKIQYVINNHLKNLDENQLMNIVIQNLRSSSTQQQTLTAITNEIGEMNEKILKQSAHSVENSDQYKDNIFLKNIHDCTNSFFFPIQLNYHHYTDQQSSLITEPNFHNLNYDQQQVYLQHLISSQESKLVNGSVELKNTNWICQKAHIRKKYRIGEGRLHKIARFVFENGKIGYHYVHGNAGKTPANKISEQEYQTIRNFVLSLPMEPWPCSLNVKQYYILANHTNYSQLYQQYTNQCDDPISRSSFFRDFDKIVPEVQLRTKQTDVCNTCISFRNQLNSNKNNSTIQLWNEHLAESKKRREIYQKEFFLPSDSVLFLSFDFKKNFQLPSQIQQANRLYYSSKFNVQCFGIVEEFQGKNYIYIYDEKTGSKTANEICSILFMLLKQKTQKEHLIMYADNCSGQNKNRYLMGFLSLLVELGYFKTIRVKFLVVGHTHFNPDRAFGWISKQESYNDLYDISDVEYLCNISSQSIHATIISVFQNWKQLIERFYGEVFGISKMAEVCFHKDHLGDLFYSDSLTHPSVVPQLEQYKKIKIKNQNETNVNLESLENLDQSMLSEKKNIRFTTSC
jgi:hypothetical protein